MKPSHVGRQIRHYGLRLIPWLVTLNSIPASYATDWLAVYSDGELLKKGAAAYGSNDCSTALPFLYAYVQKRPAALSQSTTQQESLRTALSACDRRVRGATSDNKGDAPGNANTKANLPNVTFQMTTVVGAPSDGTGTNGRCDIYASIAVAQQRANLTQTCGFSGSRWSDQYRIHYDWCVNGAPAVEASRETIRRQRLLESCRP